MSKKIGVIVAFISIILGLYIINGAFAWLTMPDFILKIGQWITAIAGIILIIWALLYLYKKANNPYSV